MITRRQFLKASSLAGVGLFVPLKGGTVPSTIALRAGSYAKTSSAAGIAASQNLTRWMDKLPIPPVLVPNTEKYPNADYYEISMEQRSWQFHSQLNAAPSWGYWSGSTGIGYLGPTIVAQQGRPVVVKYTNELPYTHLLHDSIDWSLHSMEGLPASPESRAVPHLHGGFTAPQFDGNPDAWFAPNGDHGMKYSTLPGANSNQAIFQYSNMQPGCMLWYHDHAMGITRLNVYAGLAALYLLRDDNDTGVVGRGLNIPKGAYEVPIVIQDKLFNPDGSMFYPTTSDLDDPYPHPIWEPEFFGDTPVVNAKAYPYLEVEPRRYRLRFVNGSQARFYDLSFVNRRKAVPFNLIGMEQSLLPNKSVQLTHIVLAPAERADIIIDFADVPFGTTLTLVNSAKIPYPDGDEDALTQIMQFRVNVPLKSKDTTSPAGRLVLPAISRLTATSSAPIREIVMRETIDEATDTPTHVRLNGKWFSGTEDNSNTIDETPKAGTTEIWQFINLTVDAHPMHMHLVKFQVYDRQPFDAAAYMIAWDTWQAGKGTKPVLANYFTGPAMAAPPEEMGWKDTVKALPGQITRIIAKFDLPPLATLPADYVYHCHILEHEENEMMRPFQVVQ